VNSREGGAWRSLHGLRIGCVQYLNSRPLIHGYDGEIILAHPSELARQLAAGELDAALVPVFTALRDPRFLIVDGVAIAADGPVASVLLAHRVPLSEVHTVTLDRASLTSRNLLRVILAEFQRIDVEFREAPGEAGSLESGDEDARLLIGNHAIAFRDSDTGGAWQILDLADEWKRCTGLPFVFAAWVMRADLADAAAAAGAFRALKNHGLAHLDEIIADDSTSTSEFRRRYLKGHIHFDLGSREKAGLARFRELLARHGLIDDASTPLRYV
jgi:chorismate dehydratase